jgi:hypothetical protein
VDQRFWEWFLIGLMVLGALLGALYFWLSTLPESYF